MNPGDCGTPSPDLADRLRSAGIAARVFVLADSDAIAGRAPAWAGCLAEAGLVHRVRFWEGPADEEAIVALAAEATRFEARGVVAAGGPATRTVAGAVAAAASLPCIDDVDEA